MEGRDKVGMKDFDLLKVLGTGGKWIWFQNHYWSKTNSHHASMKYNQLKAKQLSTFLLVQILKLYYYFLIKFEMITLKVIDMNVWGGRRIMI